MFRRKEDYPNSEQSAQSTEAEFNSHNEPEEAVVSPAFSSVKREVTEPSAAENHAAFDTIKKYPERPTERTYKASEPMRKTEENRPAGTTASSPFAVGNNNQKKDKPAKRVLTVGEDTVLKGEISTCDKVFVEGGVEAKLSDVQSMEIMETGVFRGSAIVEEAEISGTFEGDLIVKNKLVVFGSGRIVGKVTYGEIEIERGGRIIGELEFYDENEFNFDITSEDSNEESEEPKAKKSAPKAKARASETSEPEKASSISELFAN